MVLRPLLRQPPPLPHQYRRPHWHAPHRCPPPPQTTRGELPSRPPLGQQRRQQPRLRLPPLRRAQSKPRPDLRAPPQRRHRRQGAPLVALRSRRRRCYCCRPSRTRRPRLRWQPRWPPLQPRRPRCQPLAAQTGAARPRRTTAGGESAVWWNRLHGESGRHTPARGERGCRSAHTLARASDDSERSQLQRARHSTTGNGRSPRHLEATRTCLGEVLPRNVHAREDMHGGARLLRQLDQRHVSAASNRGTQQGQGRRHGSRRSLCVCRGPRRQRAPSPLVGGGAAEQRVGQKQLLHCAVRQRLRHVLRAARRIAGGRGQGDRDGSNAHDQEVADALHVL